MSSEVEFIAVGRTKKTWRTVLTLVTWRTLIAAVRRSGALLSADIDITFDGDGQHGCVWAGMHYVGKWRIITVLSRETNDHRN